MQQDESPVRGKLRKALFKKLVGKGVLDPTVHAAIRSEVQRLLSLPRLEEQHLALAEVRIKMLLDNRNMKENPKQGPYNDVIANNAKLPRIGVGIKGGRGAHDNWDSSSHDMPPAPHRRPAPVRDEKETLSTGRGKKKRTSVVSKSWDAEVPRLTDAELRSIPRPELLGLIQDLASPEFLAKHQIVGAPSALAAKLNKENILAIYNLLFDSGSSAFRGATLRVRHSVSKHPRKQRDVPLLEKRNIQNSYEDQQPPWQQKKKNSNTPLSSARMPRIVMKNVEKDPILNVQEVALKSVYQASAPYGVAGFAGQADEASLRSPVPWDRKNSEEEARGRRAARDFVKENLDAAIKAPLRPQAAKFILLQEPEEPSHAPGAIPEYLVRRKEELARREARREAANAANTLQPIPEEQRLEVLSNLKGRYQDITNELNTVSFRSIADSHVRPLVVQRTKLLETQLREIETAIRHFSRPKVYVST